MDPGFTLIEMVVAVVIIAIAMMAVAEVFVSGVAAAGSSSRYSDAVAVATHELEAMRAVPYSQLGFYGDQPGYQATWNGQQTVEIAPATPAGVTPAVDPTGTDTVAGTSYSVNRYVVWDDAASTSPPTTWLQAYKGVAVSVAWGGTGGGSIQQSSIVYPGGLGPYTGPGGTTTTSTTSVLQEAPATPSVALAVPSAPAGQSEIDVTWTEPVTGGPVSSFVVLWAPTADLPSGWVQSPSQPYAGNIAYTYQVQDLAPATGYTFEVSAFGPGGTTTSPPATATTLPTTSSGCTYTDLTVSGASGASYSAFKTYLNKDGSMSEALDLAVNVGGSCTPAPTITVEATAPSGGADPGSPYGMTGVGGSWTGSVQPTGTWQLGTHAFGLLVDGSAPSPAVTYSFLVCAWTPPGQRTNSPGTC